MFLDLHHQIARSASPVLCSVCLSNQSSDWWGHSSLFGCNSLSEAVAMSVDSFVERLRGPILLVGVSLLAFRKICQFFSCGLCVFFTAVVIEVSTQAVEIFFRLKF